MSAPSGTLTSNHQYYTHFSFRALTVLPPHDNEYTIRITNLESVSTVTFQHLSYSFKAMKLKSMSVSCSRLPSDPLNPLLRYYSDAFKEITADLTKLPDRLE